MAGVGFKLRHFVKKESFSSLAKAYGYSTIVGAGPWILSVIVILLILFVVNYDNVNEVYIRQFVGTITFITINSLILSSFGQHAFTRYVSDSIFEENEHKILPALLSICIFLTSIFGFACYILVDLLFPAQGFAFKLLFAASFVVMMGLWPCVNLLVGLKKTKILLTSFLISHSLILVLSIIFKADKLMGLMGSFFIGQFLNFAIMLSYSIKTFFSQKVFDLEFIIGKRTFFSLMLTSFFFNLGVWVDKYIFWYSDKTGYTIIGIIHGSGIYDLPMFIAFVLMIPAFAVFFFRTEADFAIYYDQYYEAVRDGGTLNEIYEKRDLLVKNSTEVIMDILKVQSIVVLSVCLFGDKLLETLNIPAIHYYLLRIDVLSATFFLVLSALMNIFFYLDRRKEVLFLSISLFLLNLSFTLITLHLGIFYYGYGFCVSLFLCCIASIIYLNNDFKYLEYKTFMINR